LRRDRRPHEPVGVPRACYASRGMRAMTTDMTCGDKRPYFLWDEDISIGELRIALRTGREDERLRLMGKMLREARDIDVWHFVRPEEVARALPALGRRLGRRRAFWEFLIRGWREDGIIAA
jgi:hypothetical protein